MDVVNAGIDGQSTIGHIWNFQDWFPKIENLKTKYFIFYIGLNERIIDDELSKYDNIFNLSNLNFLDKTIFYLS